MISLLTRIGLPRAFGLCFENTAVHAVGLTATPFGRFQTEHYSEPLDPQRPLEGVRRLLARLPRRKSDRLPVAIGVPTEETYFSSRPINIAANEASPRVLLREALRSSNARVEEMAVDVVKSQPEQRHVASIAACREDYIEPLVEAVQEQNLRLVRAEPAPVALLRVALKQQRAVRRTKVSLRLFLSGTHVLAMFTVGSQPLMWRRVKLPRGDETSALVTVIRSLVAAREHCGVRAQPATIVIHGRPDLKPLLDVDWIQEQVQTCVLWTDTPELDGAEIARGLAEGCFDHELTTFDLAKGSKSAARFRDIIPWPEIALQFALVLLLALFLAHRLTSIRKTADDLGRHHAQHPVASLPLNQLQQERNSLQQRVSAVKRFLDTRVLWSAHARELSDSLPNNIYLTSFHGVGELPLSGKKAKGGDPKKTLVIKGAVLLPQDGAIPFEVNSLLAALRNDSTLTDDFAVIELADLKQLSQPGNERRLATFTILCVPAGGKKKR